MEALPSSASAVLMDVSSDRKKDTGAALLGDVPWLHTFAGGRIGCAMATLAGALTSERTRSGARPAGSRSPIRVLLLSTRSVTTLARSTQAAMRQSPLLTLTVPRRLTGAHWPSRSSPVEPVPTF